MRDEGSCESSLRVRALVAAIVPDGTSERRAGDDRLIQRCSFISRSAVSVSLIDGGKGPRSASRPERRAQRHGIQQEVQGLDDRPTDEIAGHERRPGSTLGTDDYDPEPSGS